MYQNTPKCDQTLICTYILRGWKQYANKNVENIPPSIRPKSDRFSSDRNSLHQDADGDDDERKQNYGASKQAFLPCSCMLMSYGLNNKY